MPGRGRCLDGVQPDRRGLLLRQLQRLRRQQVGVRRPPGASCTRATRSASSGRAGRTLTSAMRASLRTRRPARPCGPHLDGPARRGPAPAGAPSGTEAAALVEPPGRRVALQRPQHLLRMPACGAKPSSSRRPADAACPRPTGRRTASLSSRGRVRVQLVVAGRPQHAGRRRRPARPARRPATTSHGLRRRAASTLAPAPPRSSSTARASRMPAGTIPPYAARQPADADLLDRPGRPRPAGP